MVGYCNVFSILVWIDVVLDGDSDCITIGIMVFVMWDVYVICSFVVSLMFSISLVSPDNLFTIELFGLCMFYC